MRTVKMPDRISLQYLRELADSCNCELKNDRNGDLVFVDKTNIIRASFGKIRMNLAPQPTPPGAA